MSTDRNLVSTMARVYSENLRHHTGSVNFLVSTSQVTPRYERLNTKYSSRTLLLGHGNCSFIAVLHMMKYDLQKVSMQLL